MITSDLDDEQARRFAVGSSIESDLAVAAVTERIERGVRSFILPALVVEPPEGFVIVDDLGANSTLITDAEEGSGRVWVWPIMPPNEFSGWTIEEWNEQYPEFQISA